jgi:hypothetical protein
MQLAIDFDAARAEGERQGDLCAAKAEKVSDFDSEGAGRFILSQLVRHGDMSGEALTDAAKSAGFRPHDDRAFGAVFQRLSRQGQIRTVAFCLRAKGRGTAGGRIWGLVR